MRLALRITGYVLLWTIVISLVILAIPVITLAALWQGLKA